MRLDHVILSNSHASPGPDEDVWNFHTIPMYNIDGGGNTGWS